MAEMIEVKGLKELHDRLLNFENKVIRSTLKSAVMNAAKIIADEAKSLVPVSGKEHRLGKTGPIVQPGFLKKQIGRRSIRTKDGQVQVNVGIFKRRSDPGVAFYGLFIERGSSKQSPSPFLRPALDAKKEDYLKRVSDQLKARIEAREGAASVNVK